MKLLPLAPPGWPALWAGGTAMLIALYTVVFVATGARFGWAVSTATANVAPLAGLALATHALLKTYVMPLSVERQAMVHALAAPAFAVTWYALTVVTLAFFAGLSSGNYGLTGFYGSAFIWQTFQGLILYALVAATCYAIRGGRMAASAEVVARGPALDRYLIRDGEGMSPIAVGEIVTITGAQDYSEVATGSGRHLVRLSLGEFEQRLDPQMFLRVHRSTIINFARLERAEPAGGGRLLAHMANGEIVQVSRSGAALLRAFVV
ncbi:MAG: LytTR family DNA-binding domain-containing protein [Pseudomonadota bacterium]